MNNSKNRVESFAGRVMLVIVAFLGGVAYSVDAYRYPVLAMLAAGALLGLALSWQKRGTIARRAAGSLLGYADGVDARSRAVARWHRTISGSIEEELREAVRERA